jgi:high affinity Mn2+ porin
MKQSVCALALLLAAFAENRSLHAQPALEGGSGNSAQARWNIYVQSTSIGQLHGPFLSPYEGPNSLPGHAERRVSLTGTIFTDLRLSRSFDFVFDPEMAGGRGFGSVTGIAGFTNGEIPRVSAATPSFYCARAYLRGSWNLGAGTEPVEGGPNQLGGQRERRRISWIAGKFAMSDFFDNNSYSHDPRTQFMNWSLMYNGAWDYPADTRGYTIGTALELAMVRWSLRMAAVMEPTVANGPELDAGVTRNRGTAMEWERRTGSQRRPGAVRVLAFYNRAQAGAYRRATTVEDLTQSRRAGAKKYGFGFNVEQALSSDVGVFGRYGWNDGKTETWAFTEIDRSVSAGISVGGRSWKRSMDRLGVGAARNYLSGDHASYLAAGGTGFLIGDGRLNYRPESVAEVYYAVPIGKGLTITLDYQRVANPAYNQDRGPVDVGTLRLHWETSWRDRSR